MLPNARPGYRRHMIQRKMQYNKFTRLLNTYIIQPALSFDTMQWTGLTIFSCVVLYGSIRVIATIRAGLCYYDFLWYSVGCSLIPSNNRLYNLYGIITPSQPTMKFNVLDQSINSKVNTITQCWSSGEWISYKDLSTYGNNIHELSFAPYVGRLAEHYRCYSNDWTGVDSHKYLWMPYGHKQYIDTYTDIHKITNDAVCTHDLQHVVPPIDYCNILNGRSVLIVGDSIQKEFYLSLLAQVASTTYDSYSDSVTICTDTESIKLTFVRNDYLLLDDEIMIENGQQIDIRFHQSFESLLHTHQIVILNKGIHVLPTDQYTTSLRNTLSIIRQRHPNTLLIWRTHTAGHADCMKHTQPLKTRTVDTTTKTVTYNKVDWPKGPKSGLDYGWQIVESQNQLAVDIVTDARINALVLDTAAATQWRPDGHVSEDDCLHYCLPSGVVDYWSVLLYNVLNVYQQISA